MNDPNITREIARRIGPRLPIKDITARLLDQPDKVDPLNMWVVLVVEARINGKPGAWVVQTRNETGGELISRLIDGAVEEIFAKPNQDKTSATADRRSVG